MLFLDPVTVFVLPHVLNLRANDANIIEQRLELQCCSLPRLLTNPQAITRIGEVSKIKYYAHTAESPGDLPLLETSGQWQLLSTHLRQVAGLAKQFAAPLGLAAEAELAGLLHDLGKYAQRFQARLHDNSIHGVNHWAAGAAQAPSGGSRGSGHRTPP